MLLLLPSASLSARKCFLSFQSVLLYHSNRAYVGSTNNSLVGALICVSSSSSLSFLWHTSPSFTLNLSALIGSAAVATFRHTNGGITRCKLDPFCLSAAFLCCCLHLCPPLGAVDIAGHPVITRQSFDAAAASPFFLCPTDDNSDRSCRVGAITVNCFTVVLNLQQILGK